MCGIVGYIGKQPAAPILIEGLKRLEYRGYDSAGIATVDHDVETIGYLRVEKKKGRVSALQGEGMPGTVGIGHTRWATHGEPSERNAHPHCSRFQFAVVHNGIIENHTELRAELQTQDVEFVSGTDSEVIPHLIEREWFAAKKELRARLRAAGEPPITSDQHDELFEMAVWRTLSKIEGAYAILVAARWYPDKLIAACKSSPLVIGIGTDELYIASDELAFAGKVDAVVHVKDGESVVLKRNGTYTFRGVSLTEREVRLEKPHIGTEVSKGGYIHFMHKEIHEQPQTMRNVMAGRFRYGYPVTFGGLTSDIERRLIDARRVVLVGCGTSLFAAMVGRMLIEQWGGALCEAEQAAEFVTRGPALNSQDVVIGISQSGETADTLRALEYAKERHALLVGVTNRVGSALSRRVRAGMYLHAGPEVAVASTKAFTAQVALLTLFAVRLAELRGRPAPEAVVRWLHMLPAMLTDLLASEATIKIVAERIAGAQRLIVIGRGYGVPLALEAALKLREVAYLDAHGLSAAELKHGTLALVEQGTPVVAFMPGGSLRTKMQTSLEEVRARGGEIIEFEPPSGAPDELLPLLLAPSVQLLAYHLGVARGVDVDRPRNLAKSVTVE